MPEDVQAYAPDLFQVHNWDAQRFTAIKIWFKNAFNVVLASDVLSYKERILTIHCFWNAQKSIFKVLTNWGRGLGKTIIWQLRRDVDIQTSVYTDRSFSISPTFSLQFAPADLCMLLLSHPTSEFILLLYQCFLAQNPPWISLKKIM